MSIVICAWGICNLCLVFSARDYCEYILFMLTLDMLFFLQSFRRVCDKDVEFYCTICVYYCGLFPKKTKNKKKTSRKVKDVTWKCPGPDKNKILPMPLEETLRFWKQLHCQNTKEEDIAKKGQVIFATIPLKFRSSFFLSFPFYLSLLCEFDVFI